MGRRGPNRTVLPVNQVVTPLGTQVELPGLRPQALALSPDGRILVTSGKTSELVVVDPGTGAVRQRVELPKTKADPQAPSANVLRPDKDGQLSYTGLRFSPDGRRAFLSDVNGSVVVLDVAEDATLSVSRAIPLPDARAPRRREEIPAGLAVSPDGKTLYVCGNLSNTLLELEVASGRVLRVFDVGVAPYDVVLAGGKAYVSNWGGRRPGPGELTGPAGRGTVVKVDPVRHVASEGSVTVIDLASGKPRAEIVTGLHASALAVSPDGRHVVCANAASDTLTVIETRTDTVAETIWAKPSPADLFGAQPNALAFDPSGRTLYVANGTQNAVAVVAFDPAERESKLQGLIPVGWFPGALVFDAPRRTLHVANIKGHAALPKPYEEEGAQPGATGFNSHHYHGSLSLVPLPETSALPALSETVWRNLRRERVAEALLPPRPGQPARAVPERIGEPSLIKHVVYVIKENRTYDQVLGDVAAGNGDPSLCLFGAQGHAQPAQAGPRVRAARQHLLRRHPQRRRPPVEHDRDRHRLPRALLRRLAAQLPRRHGRGRGRRARLLPRGLPLGQRAAARREDPQLRRVHGPRGEVARPEEGRHAALPRELPDLEGRERRGGLRELPLDRDDPALLAHRLRRVGDGRARPVPGRLHHRGARSSSSPGGSSRSSRSSACPTTTRAAPAPDPPPRRRRWPTTTSPSAASSRP